LCVSMGTMVLLDLMGGVALLLWGLHMVHSGILRAFGPDLRLLLAKALDNRFKAFAAGLGLTALLQSSTATALITSSFTAEGLVSLVPALAIMLGANVGTTLIVQVLSFNIAAVAPVLFIIGLVAFRSGPRSRIKDIGRVAIGLGLMLLALHILLDTLAPAENAPGARVFMNAITGDPVLCILIGAVVTWVVHSSVASVLLIMSLAYAHFVTPFAALALVLGANLGSAINPVFEGARRDNPASYRLPLGNLVNRVDSLDEAIKLYVTKLTRGSLDEREGKRAMEIISFAINLEHIGDIIDKNLSELATKKIKRRFQFSQEGAEELPAFHNRTTDSLRIAFGVFMSGDVNEARKLLAEKAALRNTELAATERHLDRLREGRPETIETTSLHLDVLRDLRRIHSHICSVAYPVLDAAGELPARQNAEDDPATLPSPAAHPSPR